MSTFAVIVAVALLQIGLPVLLVTYLWPPQITVRMRALETPKTNVAGLGLTAIALVGLIGGVGIAVGWPPVPDTWDTATRLQAGQTFVTVLAFLIAAAAGWFAAHEWEASRRQPDLRIEWRSTLIAQQRDWSDTRAVVPAWETHEPAGWHVDLRIMNYGSLAASNVLVEIQAAAQELRLLLRHGPLITKLEQPAGEEWREQLLWGPGWQRIGHLRPQSLIYPRTPPVLTYRLVLVEPPHNVVDGDALVVSFRTLCSEQRAAPATQELTLDLRAGRANWDLATG